MPTAKLSRVSKFGFQVEGADQVDGKVPWVNLSKYEKSLSMNGLKAGDTVEYTIEKGYVVSLKKTGDAPAGQAPAEGKSQARSSGEPDAKDLRISRLSVLSTAFGEPFKTLAAREDATVGDAFNDAFALAEDMLKYVVSGKLPGSEEGK